MKRAILVAAFVAAMTAGSALGVFVSGWGAADSSIVPVVSASSAGSTGGSKTHDGEVCELGSGLY